MKHFSQLRLEKRYRIYSLLKTGHNQSEIAKVIGVHKSTPLVGSLNVIVVAEVIGTNKPIIRR